MHEFHFLRPYYLLALIPLAFIIWQLTRLQFKRSGWQGFVAPHLANKLIHGQSGQAKLPVPLIAFCWFIASVALAGPTWQRLPQAVFAAESGRVVLLDLSMSMRSEDIKPNRLTKARYKAMELAGQLQEGDVGLIAYAGDAFVISPLTPDSNNLVSLIPTLSPELMPVKGSYPLLGLEKAAELLTNAGYQQGDIFWLTDGIKQNDIDDIDGFIQNSAFRLLTIGIGTPKGAPIKLESGQLLKDSRGGIVIPKLDASLLQNLSRRSGGYYVDITADDSDIQTLLSHLSKVEKIKKTEEENQVGDQWQESGPWLVLLLLPFAAYAFRRGLVYLLPYAVLPLSLLLLAPQQVEASVWDDLWKTKDQQASEAYEKQDYENAAQLFKDKKWQAASEFKQGNYEQAAELLEGLNDADSLYNKGNALANLGKLEEAISAYDEALKKQPKHEKALKNRQLAGLLKQQQEQEQQKQDGEQQDGEQQDGEQQDGEQQDGEQQDGEQQDGEQQDGEQQDGEQQDGEQQDGEQQDGEQQDGEQQDGKQQDGEQQDGEQQDGEQQGGEQQDGEQQDGEEQEAKSGEEGEESEEQSQAVELTDEEREAQEQDQVIQRLLRKVDDDPAFLLKRKMYLEHKKRQRTQQPNGVSESW